MAFDATPTELWANYTFDVGSDDTLHIPRTDLPGLLAADCSATTGDLRAILLALHQSASDYYAALADADAPAAMVVKTPRYNVVSSGNFAGYTRVTFGADFYISLGDPAVLDEPA